MDNIELRFKYLQKYDKLSSLERYTLNNIYNLSIEKNYFSADETRLLFCVGSPTIYRIVKKLDYKSYGEFFHDLAIYKIKKMKIKELDFADDLAEEMILTIYKKYMQKKRDKNI